MLSLPLNFKKLNNHNPIFFNTVLWFCSFTILLFIFSKGKIPVNIDYIYTFGFLVSIIIPVLINLYILIPRFLKQEKYLYFIIAFIANLILFSQLHVHYFQSLLDSVFPNYFFISYHSNTSLIIVFAIFLVATTLIKLSEDWFHFNRNENRTLKVKNQQIHSQLATLKSQINPHFLFNSLNVIYALAIEKKEGIEDAIVQLSDILRYVIYDSDTERVSLKDEIKLLKNYIEFQKYRVHGFNNITFNTNIENKDFKLYPMLLLPLIENSFKHGIKGNLDATFIDINITQKRNKFNFKIKNNVSEELSENNTEKSGVGLKNIQKNLDIVYPNSHQFKITKTKDQFTVSLTVIPI